jgi:hypothetical protein
MRLRINSLPVNFMIIHHVRVNGPPKRRTTHFLAESGQNSSFFLPLKFISPIFPSDRTDSAVISGTSCGSAFMSLSVGNSPKDDNHSRSGRRVVRRVGPLVKSSVLWGVWHFLLWFFHFCLYVSEWWVDRCCRSLVSYLNNYSLYCKRINDWTTNKCSIDRTMMVLLKINK